MGGLVEYHILEKAVKSHLIIGDSEEVTAHQIHQTMQNRTNLEKAQLWIADSRRLISNTTELTNSSVSRLISFTFLMHALLQTSSFLEAHFLRKKKPVNLTQNRRSDKII